MATSTKETLLGLLRQSADDHGKVRIEPEEMRKRLGLSAHDLNKFIWDWRARGMLTFKEDKVGSQVRVADIRLRNGKDRSSRPSKETIDLVEMAIRETSPVRPDGWREWNPKRISDSAGISVGSVWKALGAMRESGTLVQLGGGAVGARIGGIKFRDDRYEEKPVDTLPAETTAEAQAPVQETQGTTTTVPVTKPVSDIAKRFDEAFSGEWQRQATRVKQYREARELAGNPFVMFDRDRDLEYMVILDDRIQILESALRAAGIEVPA